MISLHIFILVSADHGVQCGYILNALKMEYIQDSQINGLFLTSRNDGKPQETYQAN